MRGGETTWSVRASAPRESAGQPLLLPIAIACAAGIGVAIHAPGVSARAWALAAVVTTLTAVATAMLQRPRIALAALLLGALTFGAMRLAASCHELPANHLGRLSAADLKDGLLLELEAVAIERPRPGVRRGALAQYDHRAPRWRFRAQIIAVVESRGDDGVAARHTPARGMIWLSASDNPGVGAGERFTALGWLHPPTAPRNPGERDARQFARLTGIVGTLVVDAGAVRPIGAERGAAATLRRLRAAMREHGEAVLRHALPDSLDAEPRGLIRAMLLGERHEGLDELEPAFRRTGLAHLLAISGFHLAVLASAATILVRGGGAAARRGALAVTVGVVPYLLMVESAPSVLRAGVMLLAIAAASTFGRGWSVGGTLALALLAIIIPWPGDLARPGLQLSFGVVAGLVWIAPRIRERWFAPPDRDASSLRDLLVERARASAAIAVTAWLVSTPLILFHFGMASTLAVPLSLIGIPLAAVLLLCGHLMLVATPLLGDGCHAVGAVVALLAELLVAFVRHADTLPGVAIFRPNPGPVWLAAALLTVVALGIAPRTMPTPRDAPRRPWPSTLERLRRALVRVHDRVANPIRRHGIPLLCAALLAWPLRVPTPLPPETALRVDMLAVGDGTCLLLRTGTQAMLYDAGSTDLSIGGRTIVPALRALGVRRLDLIVISHADADHYAGVPEIVAEIPVDAVIVTDELIERARTAPGPVRTTVSALIRRGVPIELAAQGVTRRWGPVTMRWLHPPAGWRTDRSNDHSQVILVEVAGRRLLLCGDIEDRAVAALREAHPSLGADIVELPHHGSWRQPAADLVVALRPAVILQSTGRRRLERDPWAPLLERTLPAARRQMTARDGAAWVEVGTDGALRLPP